MGDQRTSRRCPEPGHHVEDAVREARALQHLAQHQRGQRRQLARLDHDRVAGGQCRRHLLGENQQRVVPGRDLSHDPKWDATRVVEVGAAEGRDGVLVGAGEGAEILVPFGQPAKLRRQFAHRTPGLADLDRDEFRHARAQAARGLGKNPRPFLAGGGAPIGESRCRRRDGRIDVRLATFGDHGDHLCRRRVLHFEGRTGLGRNLFSANEHRGDRQAHGAASPSRLWMTCSLVMTQPSAVRMQSNAAACRSGPSMVSTQSSTTTAA